MGRAPSLQLVQAAGGSAGGGAGGGGAWAGPAQDLTVGLQHTLNLADSQHRAASGGGGGGGGAVAVAGQGGGIPALHLGGLQQQHAQQQRQLLSPGAGAGGMPQGLPLSPHPQQQQQYGGDGAAGGGGGGGAGAPLHGHITSTGVERQPMLFPAESDSFKSLNRMLGQSDSDSFKQLLGPLGVSGGQSGHLVPGAGALTQQQHAQQQAQHDAASFDRALQEMMQGHHAA